MLCHPSNQQENAELDARLKEIKPFAKSINRIEDPEDLAKELSLLKEKIVELKEMERHYQRKENIFFPIGFNSKLCSRAKNSL